MQCPREKFQRRSCVLLALFMATRTISAASTCQTPPTFGSLSGRPARSLNDCFWDFAQCSHNDPLHCCQERFKNCCMYITNSLPPPPLETTTTTTTTTVPPTTTQPPTLIGCVWRFNGCVQDKYNRGQSDESICHQRFDDCKMIVMGNMMAMMDNSVDELPMPFMSVEAATMSPPSHESKPTLIQCLSGFFRCTSGPCQQNFAQCSTAAMGP